MKKNAILQDLIGCKPPKNISQIINDSIKLDAPFQHFATIYVQDKDGVITDIGQSRRNNLILDNFGTWLAGLMRAPAVAVKEVILKDDGGVNRTVAVYGTFAVGDLNFNNSNRDTGTDLRIGSGVTAATRADVTIETPFGTAPESGYFDTGRGSYTFGVISVSAAITAGGVGSISEIGLFGTWFKHDDVGALYRFMLMHDIVTGNAVVFVAGQTITITYTINL